MKAALDEFHERRDHSNAADLYTRLIDFRAEIEKLYRTHEVAAQELQKRKLAAAASEMQGRLKQVHAEHKKVVLARMKAKEYDLLLAHNIEKELLEKDLARQPSPRIEHSKRSVASSSSFFFFFFVMLVFFFF